MVVHSARPKPQFYSDPHRSSSGVSGLSVGAIVAICIGAIFAVMGAVAWAYHTIQRRRETNKPAQKLSLALRKGQLKEDDEETVTFPRSLGPKKRSTTNSSYGAADVFRKRNESASSPPSASDCEISFQSQEDELCTNEIRNNVDLGKLEFGLNYHSVNQTLSVTIIKAINLPVKDAQMGSSDPYVKLQLLPEKRHKVKTRILRKTLNPVYDETFTFYGITTSQLNSLSLHFVALSFDRFSRDDIIGEVLCPLIDMNLEQCGSLIQIFDLQPRQYKIHNQCRGELLISMCYQPAANRLTAVVLKARNLPKLDVTGLAGDPYVKLYLLYNGQRIAKKKTHVKKRTLNPVYNESFIFEVPANEGLRNLSMEFLILDWDRVTKNEVIGRLELGLAKSDLADKHWQEVMSCPRKQIAEWHKLQE